MYPALPWLEVYLHKTFYFKLQIFSVLGNKYLYKFFIIFIRSLNLDYRWLTIVDPSCSNLWISFALVANRHFISLFGVYDDTCFIMMFLWWCIRLVREQSTNSQREHDVYATSHQRRCNVTTLHRRWYNVVSTQIVLLTLPMRLLCCFLLCCCVGLCKYASLLGCCLLRFSSFSTFWWVCVMISIFS